MPQVKRDRQSQAVRALAGMHIKAAADEGKPHGPSGAWEAAVAGAAARWTDAEVDAAIAAAAEEEAAEMVVRVLDGVITQLFEQGNVLCPAELVRQRDYWRKQAKGDA